MPFSLKRNLSALYLIKVAKWMNRLFCRSRRSPNQYAGRFSFWFCGLPVLIKTGLRINMFGVVWALLNLTVGITAKFAWRIESKLGPRRTVVLFTFFLLLGYFELAMAGTITGFIFLLFFYMARGLATPTLRNYINVIAKSETRTTVLSILNFIIRALFALLAPLYGLITDRYGLSTALLLAGGIFTVLSGISLFFFLRYKTYQ